MIASLACDLIHMRLQSPLAFSLSGPDPPPPAPAVSEAITLLKMSPTFCQEVRGKAPLKIRKLVPQIATHLLPKCVAILQNCQFVVELSETRHVSPYWDNWLDSNMTLSSLTWFSLADVSRKKAFICFANSLPSSTVTRRSLCKSLLFPTKTIGTLKIKILFAIHS